MSTTTTTYSFPNDSQGWSATADTNGGLSKTYTNHQLTLVAVSGQQTSQGLPPGVVGANASGGTQAGYWSLLTTWSALGVPSGSQALGVTLTLTDRISTPANQTATSGPHTAFGSTLLAGRSATASESATTQRTGSELAVPANLASSTSQVEFRLVGGAVNGSPNGEIDFSNVALAVRYGPVPITGTAAASTQPTPHAAATGTPPQFRLATTAATEPTPHSSGTASPPRFSLAAATSTPPAPHLVATATRPQFNLAASANVQRTVGSTAASTRPQFTATATAATGRTVAAAAAATRPQFAATANLATAPTSHLAATASPPHYAATVLSSTARSVLVAATASRPQFTAATIAATAPSAHAAAATQPPHYGATVLVAVEPAIASAARAAPPSGQFVVTAGTEPTAHSSATTTSPQFRLAATIASPPAPVVVATSTPPAYSLSNRTAGAISGNTQGGNNPSPQGGGWTTEPAVASTATVRGPRLSGGLGLSLTGGGPTTAIDANLPLSINSNPAPAARALPLILTGFVDRSSGGLPLSVRNQDAARGLPLSLYGAFDRTTSRRQGLPLSLHGSSTLNSGHRLPLFVQGNPVRQRGLRLVVLGPQGVAAGIPLVFAGGLGDEVRRGLPLSLTGQPPFAADLPLFLSGTGTNPGFFPLSGSAILLVSRDGSAGGLPLVINGCSAGDGLPLSLAGRAEVEAGLPVWLAGSDGGVGGGLPLVLPLVQGWTADAAALPLVMATVAGALTGGLELSLAGW